MTFDATNEDQALGAAHELTWDANCVLLGIDNRRHWNSRYLDREIWRGGEIVMGIELKSSWRYKNTALMSFEQMEYLLWLPFPVYAVNTLGWNAELTGSHSKCPKDGVLMWQVLLKNQTIPQLEGQ